ncbi:MAG: glycosyltransferase [Parcubacteria group bacterium]|jgi:hypothetical protein
MKILITNNALASRSGSELYVQELAQQLVLRGHDVAAFSTQVGDLAQVMMAQGVVVVDDLAKMPWMPDIIHVQHHLETMIALAYFPQTPAIYVCHGWRPWQETPPLHPRIRAYFAVDMKTRDKAINEHHIPATQIELLHNFVDLDRFVLCSPLSAKPRKALVFSNYASQGKMLFYIRHACKKAGMSLDVIGRSSGNLADKPEEILGNYDIVFAAGRSALEAMASGASVIVCGVWGMGPLVTRDNVEQFRDQNFGSMTINHSDLSIDTIYREICHYDAKDAALVTQYLRERIGIDQTVDRLEKIYEHTIEAFESVQYDPSEEHFAYAQYIRNVAIFLKKRDEQLNEIHDSIQQREQKMKGIHKLIFWKWCCGCAWLKRKICKI